MTNDFRFDTKIIIKLFTGVDSLPQAPADSIMGDYYSADVNVGLDGAVERLKGKRFDRILLLDILKHLINPERILAQCHALLEEDGQVVVSVPNVTENGTRINEAGWLYLNYAQVYCSRSSSLPNRAPVSDPNGDALNARNS